MIQDTAYESLLKSKRRELHQKAAVLLEQQFPELVETQLELLAHHQTKAGLLIVAIQSWKKAAELARKQFANKEAINHLKQGLALTSQLSNQNEALKLEFELFDLLSKYGFNHPELKKVNEQLVIRAQKLGRSNEVFINQIAIIIGEFVGGNFNVLDQLENLLALAKADEADFSMAAIHCFMGTVCVNAGKYQRARMHGESVLDIYNPRSHGDLKLHNGANVKMENGLSYSLALLFLGYPEQAREHLKMMQKLASE